MPSGGVFEGVNIFFLVVTIGIDPTSYLIKKPCSRIGDRRVLANILLNA